MDLLHHHVSLVGLGLCALPSSKKSLVFFCLSHFWTAEFMLMLSPLRRLNMEIVWYCWIRFNFVSVTTRWYHHRMLKLKIWSNFGGDYPWTSIQMKFDMEAYTVGLFLHAEFGPDRQGERGVLKPPKFKVWSDAPHGLLPAASQK